MTRVTTNFDEIKVGIIIRELQYKATQALKKMLNYPNELVLC